MRCARIGTLHGVGSDGGRIAVLRAPRSVLVRLLVQRHPARPPLLLARRLVIVVPPVAMLFHHAVGQQAIDVSTVGGQAVLLAPALACVPVRSEGVWPMGRDVVVGESLRGECDKTAAVLVEEK